MNVHNKIGRQITKEATKLYKFKQNLGMLIYRKRKLNINIPLGRSEFSSTMYSISNKVFESIYKKIN